MNVIPDLQLTIKIADAYRNRSPRTTTMFMLVDGNPVVSSARKADGTLAFRIRPGVGGVSFEPSR